MLHRRKTKNGQIGISICALTHISKTLLRNSTGVADGVVEIAAVLCLDAVMLQGRKGYIIRADACCCAFDSA